MEKETSKEKFWRHLKSAGLTFVSVAGVELYAATEAASGWGELAWPALVSAVTFTAARAALKVLAKQ